MEDAIKPASAGHAPAAGETIAGEPQVPDAKLVRVFHQDAEDRRVQMQVQMAVDVVEGQAGGAEPVKLRVNFRPQLFAQAAMEKITKARPRPDHG